MVDIMPRSADADDGAMVPILPNAAAAGVPLPVVRGSTEGMAGTAEPASEPV
jgi:hypothetical protein